MLIESETPHKWILVKLPVFITAWFDSLSALNTSENFGYGASVVRIKVDFRGLASVSFIFSSTTRLPKTDYC